MGDLSQMFMDEPLSAAEQAKAEEYGLMSKDEPTQEVEKTQDPESNESKVEIEIETDQEPETKETPDATPEPPESSTERAIKEKRAMYQEMKEERRKRQEIEEQLTELQQKALSAKAEDSRIKDALAALTKQDITVEELTSILGGKREEKQEDDNRPLTVADLKKLQEEDIQARKKDLEAKTSLEHRFGQVVAEGQAIHKDFEKIIKAVDKFSSLPENEIYDNIISSALRDPKVSEKSVAEKIVQIARLTPEGASLLSGKTQPLPSSKTDAQRAIENSQKSSSSASVNGTGSRKLSLSNITIEELAKMPKEQFRQVSKKLGKKKMQELIYSDMR